MNSGHKKRKYALAAALVGALVLPLFGCQKNAGDKLSEEEVQRQAYEYLASKMYLTRFGMNIGSGLLDE